MEKSSLCLVWGRYCFVSHKSSKTNEKLGSKKSKLLTARIFHELSEKGKGYITTVEWTTPLTAGRNDRKISDDKRTPNYL